VYSAAVHVRGVYSEGALRERSKRVLLGLMVSIGLMGLVPATAFAGGGLACGDVLMSDTTLTADLDCSGYNGTALYMGKNRVVLNLNGHTIWGYAGSDSNVGVDTDGYNNTVIRNGTIANFYYGVDFSGSHSTKLKKLTITGEAADSGDYGVYGSYHAGTVMRRLNISGVQTGVYLEYGASAQLVNSTIAADNSGNGVYAYYESKDVFTDNVVMSDYNGFIEYYSGGNRYVGNTANDGQYGFYLYCDGYGRVFLTGNTANNNDSEGFYTYYCYGDESWAPGTGSRVTGNTAIGNDGYGFYDYYSVNAVWTNNVSKWNHTGFYMEYPGGVMMTGNTGSRNDGDGFYFYENYSSGYYNFEDFSNNVARRNGGYGMYGEYGVPGSGNISKKNSNGNCYNVACN
jgi:hypothetical protein